MVVSFYTKKCGHNCTFCDLSTHSSVENISIDDINKQIDYVIHTYENQLDKFEQISVGNEGSILEQSKFPLPSFEYLLKNLSRFKSLEILSLETRPEHINETILDKILSETKINTIDITVGFETQDDEIRNRQLNKGISKQMLEEKIAIMGKMGIRLTAYVMLKPGYNMTEVEGMKEACNTIFYLYGLCRKYNTSLVIYLNPTYISKNSRLKKFMEQSGYKPPKIQSILAVLLAVEKLHIPIYTGLNSENFSVEGGDYKAHKDFDRNILEAIKCFNKKQDYQIFHSLMRQEEGIYEGMR